MKNNLHRAAKINMYARKLRKEKLERKKYVNSSIQ